MTAYLPWLLLVCPLMMIFMMRGTGGSKNTDRDTRHKNTDGRVQRANRNQWASAQSGIGPADERDGKRLVQLEREVADLRATLEHPPGSNPTSRR